MKIYAINGSPRTKCNTAQMLNSFVEGIRAENPSVEIEYVNLYDYTYQGCRSCFACQRKENRDRLRCQIKDGLYEFLDGAFHADGIVFASPIYFFDISAQMRAFLERLMYPGDSDRVIPTSFIYTMNASEEYREKLFDAPLSTHQRFLTSTFLQEPELVYSYFTFQYNDSDAFVDPFREFGSSEEKKKHHEQQFPLDLKNAYESGRHLVQRIHDAAATNSSDNK